MDSLDRFVTAHEHMHAAALAEIKNGRKQSHWMWYIFPQLLGLGHSDMAHIYGIVDFAEAKAYLAHPILSAHLIEITEALLLHKNEKIENIFGYIDAMKLRSSMTLFALASEENMLFQQVLDCFYNGIQDTKTLQLLNM